MTAFGFQSALRLRADAAGIQVSSDVAAALEIYFDVLRIWNQRMNLAGFNLMPPSDAALDRLFIEPLLAADLVRHPAAAFIDIGSGGGSPGLPLAIATGAARSVLVEARSRKGVFLREAVRALGLSDRVEVRTERFEGLRHKVQFLGQFDLLTVRAVRVGPDEMEKLASLLKIGGQLLIFHGEGRPAPSPGQQLTFVRDLPISTASRGVITKYSRSSP